MNKSKKIFFIVTAAIFISWIAPYAVLAINTLDTGCGMSMCMCDMKKCCCESDEKNNEIKQPRCGCTLSQAGVPDLQTFLFSKTFKNNALSLIRFSSKIYVFSKETYNHIVKLDNPSKNIPLFILKESFLV